MKSFKKYRKENIDWEKETGYTKSTYVKGSGGRGGTTEYVAGFRATIHHIDEKNRKWESLIPPIQYKPVKDKKKLQKYIEMFKKDVISDGGKFKKAVIKKY